MRIELMCGAQYEAQQKTTHRKLLSLMRANSGSWPLPLLEAADCGFQLNGAAANSNANATNMLPLEWLLTIQAEPPMERY